MNDFRVHYAPEVGSYDPGDPRDWTDEYLVWFYWTHRYDEDDLRMIKKSHPSSDIFTSSYWKHIEAEMTLRNLTMHVSWDSNSTARSPDS